MPKFFMPGAVEDARPDEFVVVPGAEGDEEVAVVSGIEYRATEHLELRETPYPDAIRRAEPEEVEAWWEARTFERRAIVEAKERARSLNLPIKISMVRYHPAQKRILFHFTSENRVDFRTLAKDLAASLFLRVELWQIGIRDEARAIDGFGICGQQTCCSTFLKEFRPISVRLAREQEINLPPAKLTGQCGRFLCCLSYEVDQYREMARDALPKGATVRWRDKSGVVLDRNLVAKTYLVRDEGGTLGWIKASEFLTAAVEVPEQMKKFGRQLRDQRDDEPGSDEAPPRSDETMPPRLRERPPRGRQEERPSGRRASGHREPDHHEQRQDVTHLVPKVPLPPADADADLEAEDSSPSSSMGSNPEESGRRKRGRRRRRGGGSRSDQSSVPGGESSSAALSPPEAEDSEAQSGGSSEDSAPSTEGRRHGRRRRRRRGN